MTPTRRTPALVAAAAIAAVALFTAGAVIGGQRGGNSSYQGSSPGTPVAYTPIALPPVQIGPFNDPPPAPGSAGAFSPALEDLATGQTIITTEDQMRYAWRRLFTAPYPAGAFDFEVEFVVLMGGGLLPPDFGFEITAVEVSQPTFTDSRGTFYLSDLLAVTASTIQPGVPPKKELDPVWMVAAVSIDRDLLTDGAVFGRVDLPLP